MYKIKNNNIEIFDSIEPYQIDYTRIYAPIGINDCTVQYTTIINLDADEDVILKGFQSTTRNLVNQCKTKDAPIIEYINQPNEEIISEFLKK